MALWLDNNIVLKSMQTDDVQARMYEADLGHTQEAVQLWISDMTQVQVFAL